MSKSKLEKYNEAIEFFQKFPDKWGDLIEGMRARRDGGFSEVVGVLYSNSAADKTFMTNAIMQRMAMVNELCLDFERPRDDDDDDPIE